MTARCSIDLAEETQDNTHIGVLIFSLPEVGTSGAVNATDRLIIYQIDQSLKSPGMLPLGLFSFYQFNMLFLGLAHDPAAVFEIFLYLALKIFAQLVFLLLALVWSHWIIDSHSASAVFCKFL